MRKLAQFFKDNPRDLKFFNMDVMTQFGYYKHLLWLFEVHHKKERDALSMLNFDPYKVKTNIPTFAWLSKKSFKKGDASPFFIC